MRPVVLGLLLMLAAGCSTHSYPTTAPVTQPRAAKPLVIHLPGIGGLCDIDQTLREGLLRGGFDGPFEFFDWSCNDPGVPALHATARNRAQARILSSKIADHLRANPGRPIYITAHSAGGGIAAWALEELPAGMQIQALVMLGPALSPEYDLSKALAHIRGRLVSFYSDRDRVVLGSGTKLLGTIDGVRTEAAGKIGFRIPAGADRALYAKFSQHPYDPAWERFGNQGGHMGWMSAAFVRAIVVPRMLGREPTEADYKAAGPVKPAPHIEDPWNWK